MAQSDQSFPDSVSKNVLLVSDLYLETMKHTFPENCLLKKYKIARSPLVNVTAHNLSTTWQKLIQTFQTSFPVGICSPNNKGNILVKFHILHAVCLILKVVFEMIFKTCGLLCWSKGEWSKELTAAFTISSVKAFNCMK